MKPNKNLMQAIQNYYKNRANQQNREWDKVADLNAIFKAARQQGFGSHAIAGTFWFTYKTKRHRVTLEISEETVINISKSKKKITDTVKA